MSNVYELIIFDVDGTLAEWQTGDLLPGVQEWFDHYAAEHTIALVSNQGGVGLRYWMEDGEFGEPDKYPTEEQARVTLDAINAKLPGGPYPLFVCYAYQSKKSGKWGPSPDGDDPEWDPNRRKPAPGMIFDAIRECESTRRRTLMVGDRSEDLIAAQNAEVDYRDADSFFGRLEKMPF